MRKKYTLFLPFSRNKLHCSTFAISDTREHKMMTMGIEDVLVFVNVMPTNQTVSMNEVRTN